MKQLAGRCAFGIAAVLAAAAACAQTYPAKPVRFVVPFVAGGPTDIQGRLLGEKLAQRLGQQFIIDNRGGAGGNIGMEIVAKAPPDGHTLVIATVGTWAVNPHLYKLPDIQEKSAVGGAAIIGGTPEQFGAYLKSEVTKFEHVVKEAKISAQ